MRLPPLKVRGRLWGNVRAYFANFYIDDVDVDVDGKGDDGDGEQDDGEDDDGGVYTMYATLVEIVESYVVTAGAPQTGHNVQNSVIMIIIDHHDDHDHGDKYQT